MSYLRKAVAEITGNTGNARMTQKFGYRAPVAVLAAVRQQADTAIKSGFPLHTDPPTEREVQAKNLADNTLRIAKAAAYRTQQMEAYARDNANEDVGTIKTLGAAIPKTPPNPALPPDQQP